MSRPHAPEILDELRGRSCSFAMRIETGSKRLPKRVQHSSWPQWPKPPTMAASSRTPIWRMSTRSCSSRERSRTSWRKSTRSSAEK